VLAQEAVRPSILYFSILSILVETARFESAYFIAFRIPVFVLDNSNNN